jgi:hypothetical protein
VNRRTFRGRCENLIREHRCAGKHPADRLAVDSVRRRRAGAVVAARHASAKWRRCGKLTGASVSRSGGRGPAAKTRERRTSPRQSRLVNSSDPPRKSYSGVGESHGTAGSRGQSPEAAAKALDPFANSTRPDPARRTSCGGSEAKRQVGSRRAGNGAPTREPEQYCEGLRESQERRRDRANGPGQVARTDPRGPGT